MVDSGAEIDPSVDIGPYTVIGAQVKIDAGTSVGPHTVINGDTSIGRDNQIFQFASIGEIPQDRKYQGEASALVIGHNNTIREFTTINCGTALDRNLTRIGNDNWIMAYVHIAHDCVIGNHTIFSNGSTLAGHVEVEDHATLGGFTLVHQFCRIGRYAFSGMGTALNMDLLPFVMASGNLARPFGLNRVGLRRAEFSTETIEVLNRAYRLLMRQNAESEGELEALAEEHPEVSHMLNFAQSSKRGIIRDCNNLNDNGNSD